MIKKIISGGQTGADQAALDAAIELGIPHGGWIPKGRLTEDGVLPEKYQLEEMSTKSYPKRTEKNVLESDGTLIFSYGKPTGGSLLTIKLLNRHRKPWLHIDLDTINKGMAKSQITSWIDSHKVKVLNIAGPRASKEPRIYSAVFEIIRDSLR